MTSDTLSIVVDVNKVSDTTNQDDNIYERIKKAAQDGDIERLYKEEVLDWNDEDSNTVLHIAALTNQPEYHHCCVGTVSYYSGHEVATWKRESKSEELDGKTAMDILQTHQSPLFSPEATSSLFKSAKERLLSTTTITLAKYLSKKPSFTEKRNNAFGLTNLSKTRNTSLNSYDSRSVILVVAILIVTATYQAKLSPPGGFWQEDSMCGDRDDYLAVGIAFFLSPICDHDSHSWTPHVEGSLWFHSSSRNC
ncbi:BnaC01g21250D [Brassica napus]|uniref:(rape) hypothetical protein n=1 Tax=Brassica napus TaxID=3708 RepID=A0A078HFM0_BRANA|nr:unnamed protein product [Brassica napus]CDY35603.1 BnaC01g21250D [Brassica napus]